MVDALAPDRSNQPFGEAVLPRRTLERWLLLYASDGDAAKMNMAMKDSERCVGATLIGEAECRLVMLTLGSSGYDPSRHSAQCACSCDIAGACTAGSGFIWRSCEASGKRRQAVVPRPGCDVIDSVPA